MPESEYLLRVTDWDSIYENNRTRGLKEMRWVPIPNKLDGDGYTDLLDHPNGTAHYGVWIAILLMASRCGHPAPKCGESAPKCGKRGTLVRDSGTPHDARSLSRISRIPVEIIDEAIPRLCEIGWLESIPFGINKAHQGAVKAQESAAIPHPSAGKAHRTDYGMEGMEWNGRNTQERNMVAAGRFPEFWSQYPEKIGRDQAARMWISVVTDENVDQVFEGLARWITSERWARNIYQNPVNWLNDEAWKDEPKQAGEEEDEAPW